MSLLLCGSCIGCRSLREYSPSCACLCTRCSLGTLVAPDYIASLLTPASDIHSRSSLRSSSNCDLSYQERVGRLVKGLSLLPHPVLGIGCRPTWNSCVRLLHSRTNWKSFMFHAADSGNTVWTLESAIGLIVGGALQVTVVTFTVTDVVWPCHTIFMSYNDWWYLLIFCCCCTAHLEHFAIHCHCIWDTWHVQMHLFATSFP